MLRYSVKCDKKPTKLVVGVQVQRPTKITLRVYNPRKAHTVYLDRWKTVEKNAEFEVKMPQTSDIVAVEIRAVGMGNNVRVTKLEKKPLDQYFPCLAGRSDVGSFVKFAQEFCENLGILRHGTYTSNDKKFRIDLFPAIKDAQGKMIPTPARISNQTGRIEVSQQHFMGYSVPMRMAILCHEYSHFFENSDMKDEVEADLNGLKIYLGLGYPVIEAHKGFLNVFKNSPSQQNKERYEYVKAFIDNFEDLKYRVCLP